MKFSETSIPGSFLVEPVPIEDERGSFARTFCTREFQDQGLDARICQCSTSYNRHARTLRGLHYQTPPDSESKLVRCTRGAIYDVIVDLRPESPAFASWFATELSADNRAMLYIPERCAHGFQTLADDTEVFYQISAPYKSGASAGIRWNDPRIAVVWPRTEPIVSQRDANLPLLDEVFAPR